MKRASLALLAAIVCVAQAPMASLSGSVYDELGGPIIAAKLSLRGETSPLYLTKTTEQGRVLYSIASRTRGLDRWRSIRLAFARWRSRSDRRVGRRPENAAARDAEGPQQEGQNCL